MSKPWEQKWVANDRGTIVYIDDVDTKRIVCCDTDEHEAKFIAAAPDMARALLNHVLIRGGPDDAHAHTRACWAERTGRGNQRLNGSCTYDCMTVRSALAKAGVPL